MSNQDLGRDTYTVHRFHHCDSKPAKGNPWGLAETPHGYIETTPIAECSDHAAAIAAVVADYAAMTTGAGLAWTRPDWTAVSGTVSWHIDIRKGDGTYINGWTMGPTRLELELKEAGVSKDDLVAGCRVNVLQMKAGMARLVEGNYSGPDYILGKGRDFGVVVDDGWYVMVLRASPNSHWYGPFDTWEQAEALADKIDTFIWGVEMLADAAARNNRGRRGSAGPRAARAPRLRHR
jgi:hypothetical protein